MLHKTNRLTKVRDFNLVMAQGRWVTGGLVRLKIVRLKAAEAHFPKKVDPTEFSQQLRFAVSVGTKIAKRAVKRNRLRRQLTEIIRLWIKEGNIQTGWYVLVIAEKAALEKEYADLERDLTTSFKRAGLLR